MLPTLNSTLEHLNAPEDAARGAGDAPECGAGGSEGSSAGPGGAGGVGGSAGDSANGGRALCVVACNPAPRDARYQLFLQSWTQPLEHLHQCRVNAILGTRCRNVSQIRRWPVLGAGNNVERAGRSI